MGLSNAQNIQIFCQKVELLTNFFATSFRNLEQPNVLKRQGAIFYLWVVKPATLLFISFSSNTAKVARFRCSSHRSFSSKGILFLQWRIQIFTYGGGGGEGGRLGHPDPEIGGRFQNFFRPFGPQLRGGPRSPAPALDPPQFKASHTCFEMGFFLLISKRTSTGYLHDVVTCRSRRWLASGGHLPKPSSLFLADK